MKILPTARRWMLIFAGSTWRPRLNTNKPVVGASCRMAEFTSSLRLPTKIGRRGSSFMAATQASTSVGTLLRFSQNNLHAHAIISANSQRSKPKASAMGFRGPSLIAIPPKLLGWPSFGTEPTPTTAEVRGLSSLDESPEL